MFLRNNHLQSEEHGACVVQDRNSGKPSGTGAGVNRNAQRDNPNNRQPKLHAEFQIFDENGAVLASQRVDGKVYATGRYAPSGRNVENKQRRMLICKKSGFQKKIV